MTRCQLVNLESGDYLNRPLTNTCSAGAGGSGMRGAIGGAPMGRTSWASDLTFPAAEMGDAERARKDNSSWAVTRPAEVHLAPASFLLGNMPGAVPMSRYQ